MNQRHADQTPAGSSYHRGDPEMGDLPHRVQPDPDGRYTVDVHVTPEGNARIGGRDYTPEEFAEVLRRNGDYDGRPIRLIGCDAGSNDFARRLSRDLDTEVLAPSKPAWTDSNGRVFSSDYDIGPDGRTQPRIPPNGEWSTHSPDGTHTRTGDDAFTPDTPDSAKHDVDADSSRARGDEDASERERVRREVERHLEVLNDPDAPRTRPDEYRKAKEFYQEHWRGFDSTEPVVQRHSEATRVRDSDVPAPILGRDRDGNLYVKEEIKAEPPDFDDTRRRVLDEQERGTSSRSDSTDSSRGESESGDGPQDSRPTADDSVPERPSTERWDAESRERVDRAIEERRAAITERDSHPEKSDEWRREHAVVTTRGDALGEIAADHGLRHELHRQFGGSDNIEIRDRGDGRLEIFDTDKNEVVGTAERRFPKEDPAGDGGSGSADDNGSSSDGQDKKKDKRYQFDQVWEVKSPGPPEITTYEVVEAKAPSGSHAQRELPNGTVVKQCRRDYYDDTVQHMRNSADPEVRALGRDLEKAAKGSRVNYWEARARVRNEGGVDVYDGVGYRPVKM
ncbi:hypothetical protein BLA60_16955 [Actinophytocola xinjiangensis]|uniref:Uncharacterized protein n=1 Tax=Actinophytocola xinjiangensis TaxID=485602 RepID=A0A7Z0WLD6_9PSEU|nr:hypothetical protein [Actinophytocola xinjiangensis]OLF10137.1 hypothetical protein BLA60_16955 [Actinophytocola xinjiangensis]